LTAVSHYIQADARIKTNIGKPIKLYFKFTNTRKISLDISESPSLVKIHLLISSLKDPMLSQRMGKKKNGLFYKMITRQVIDMEVLA
jgi:hypothetical protein